MIDIQKNFSFNTTPKLKFGYLITNSCYNDLKKILGKKILFISDKGISKRRLYSGLLNNLKKINVDVLIFDDVDSDPSVQNIENCLNYSSKFQPTGILGFGGGSPMDVSKVISLLIGSNQKLDDLWGVNKAKGPRLPLGLIPTTSGTGSEVTPISIITLNSFEKRGIVTEHILPDISILDPHLTLKKPKKITAYSGIDAIVHAVEAYTSQNVNNNYLSKILAVESLKLLGNSIKSAVFEMNNKETRAKMMLGSTFAGMAFANSPVSGVHALAYPIGGIYKIPHGLSNSLILPKVIEFNYFEGKIKKDYDFLSNIIFTTDDASLKKEDEKLFFHKLKNLCKELDLPTRLRDVDIPFDACSKLAYEAMKQERLLVNNPVKINFKDALKIYEESW